MFMDMVMDEDDAHFLQRATSSVATARNLAYRIRGTKQKNEQKHANLTQTLQEDSYVFMTHSSVDAVSNDVWFVYSGCSNHMSSTRSLFKKIDESHKSDVNLPNGASIRIGGRDTVSVSTSDGNIQYIHNVQYVPSLAYNLLSVGQLMESGHYVLFDDKACTIHDKKAGQ